MLTVTEERVAIVVVTALLLGSWGTEPARVAAAFAGVAFFWWLVGPRRSTNVGRGPDTRE